MFEKFYYGYCNHGHMPIETLKNICEAVSIPVVAIGRINKENILRIVNLINRRTCADLIQYRFFCFSDISKNLKFVI
jgi:selenophosphate synthetase-related protein